MFAALTGAGLSAAAGLNAYIPLLVVGLLGRFTEQVHLPAGYTWLSSWWALGVIGLLLLLEFFVDKIAVVDHVNDVIQTLVRPASGGAVFSATTAAGELDQAVGTAAASWFPDSPILGWLAGIGIATAVHVAKALLRPLINAGTVGFGTPVASAVEDTGSAGISLVAIFAPILVILILIGMTLGGIWLFRVFRRRRRHRMARKAERRSAKRHSKAGRGNG